MTHVKIILTILAAFVIILLGFLSPGGRKFLENFDKTTVSDQIRTYNGLPPGSEKKAEQACSGLGGLIYIRALDSFAAKHEDGKYKVRIAARCREGYVKDLYIEYRENSNFIPQSQ
jgi:hypothetical protein